MRTIADFPNPVDWTVNLRNIRVEKLKFKKYLQLRYSSRVIAKILSKFDFTLPQDYRSFFRQVQDKFLPLGENLLEVAQKFAFLVFDSNGDEAIDTIDLFSFIKDFKQEGTLARAGYRDVTDIQCCLSVKQMLLAKFDAVLDETGSADGGPKIRNLGRFLSENEQRL